MSSKQRILILCTGNSCRSQMAEGFLNHFYGEQIEAFSAGSKPSGYVHPKAIEAMREAGIDISSGHSKSMAEFYGEEIDLAVTVCNSAYEECPVFPGAKRNVHHSFADPADATGSAEEIMAVFRRVRDEIQDWIQSEFWTKM